MTCFKGPILHLLPIHLFLPHFLSTLLPFLIYNSTSDASLPHSSPSLPPPVFSYLLLFPAHYFTFNSCLTFILFFPSFCTSFSHYYSVCSAPHCPPHHFVHIPFSSPFFNFLTYIFFFAPTLVFPLSSIFTHRSSSFVFLKALFLNLTLQTFLLLCLFLCFHHRHLAITASLFFLFFFSLSSPSFSNLQFFHLPSMFSFVHLFSPCPSYLSPAGSLFPSAISPPSKCSVSPALQQSAVHRFPRAHCCIPTEACTAFSHK